MDPSWQHLIVPSSKLLLFDTASLYFRAFFALPASMRALDGRSVNAVRGLLEFLARFISEAEPTHLACCWDEAWRPEWRVALVPSYKAHRVLPESDTPNTEQTPSELDHQVPWIRAVLGSLGIPVVGAPDAEADDVIGTLATSARMPVEIVTGDRDLFQLVSDEQGIAVRYVGAGMKRSEKVTDTWLVAKYGIRGGDYADFALLRGDPSDGLPGVAGIGDKTAAGLVSAHGDLEGILAAATAGGVPARIAVRLADSIDYLAAARDVVRVKTRLEGLPSLAELARPSSPADPEAFAELTRVLNLGSAASRISESLWP